jgi:Flp pilus assembly protein TadD
VNQEDIVYALRTGRPDRAEVLCRQALEQRPDDPDLLLLTGISLLQQEKRDQALPVYARLVELCPDDALHWGNYATVLRQDGQLAEATRASDMSLRLDPDNSEQLINRGLLKLQERDFLGARDALLRATELAPESAAARIHAARACSICRDYRADQLTERWREWLPLEDDLQIELADLKLVMGDANAARLLLEDLCARSSRPPIGARLLLAAVYERVNQLDQARVVMQEVLEEPDKLDERQRRDISHLSAALEGRAGNYEQARQLLEQAGPRHEYDFAHYFALGEACDKLRDVDAALAALGNAHALQVEELRQAVPARFEPGAPLLPAAVARVSPEVYRSWPNLIAPDVESSPVFIVGFPRSGTTLLEQMLDAHPSLQSMDERPFFNLLSDQLGDQGFQVPADLGKLDQHSCDELRKGYLSMVCSKIQRRWDTRLVDKNPLNMLWLPMIHRLFPQAKFILALRHPCDVLVSNYMQNYRASVLAAASASIDRLASAYVAAMECWLHHVEVFKPDVLVSRYEELVADPARQTQRIGDFLGLQDAAPLLNFDKHAREKGYIATPSYTQVIQPVNRKGLNRWHRYREALAPALPILQPMLEHWGYAEGSDS